MDWRGSAPPLLPDTAPPRVRPGWYFAPLRATRRRRRRHTGAARRPPAEPGEPPCEPATSVRALSTWGQGYQSRCPICLPEMATFYTQRYCPTSFDQLVPEEGVLHTGLLMVARVLLPLSPSSLLHLSDRAVARGRSWSPSRHGGCPGRWNDDRRATRTRSLVDATRVVGRVRREAGDVAFDLVDQIEGRRRVVNMPAGQGSFPTRSLWLSVAGGLTGLACLCRA